MEKEEVIKLIAGRIEDEHRKHPDLNWEKIAAGKIYSQSFEFYQSENEALTKRVAELELELKQETECVEHIKEVCDGYDEQIEQLKENKRELIEGIEDIQGGLIFIEHDFNNGLGFDSDRFDDKIKEISDLLLKHR